MNRSFYLEIISVAVLTVLIAFTGIFFPLLASFFWGVPIGALSARKGLKSGLLAALAALGILVLISTPQSAVLSAVQFGSLGLVLGYGFRKGSSSKAVLMQTVAVSLVVTLLVFTLPYLPASPLASIGDELSGSIDGIIAAWEDVGLMDTFPQQYSVAELKDMLQEAVDWFIRLLPSLLAISALGAAFFNFLVTRWTLSRRDYKVAEFPPFTRWWVPWYFSWVAVVGLGLALLGDYVSVRSILTLGLNLVAFHLPVALIIGFSVVAFLFSRIKSWLFQAAIVFAGFFYLPLTFLLIVIVGVFDPLFDFRKVHFKSV